MKRSFESKKNVLCWQTQFPRGIRFHFRQRAFVRLAIINILCQKDKAIKLCIKGVGIFDNAAYTRTFARMAFVTNRAECGIKKNYIKTMGKRKQVKRKNGVINFDIKIVICYK